MMTIVLTKHARKRFRERSKLSTEELSLKISLGTFVSIRMDDLINKEYLLIYSIIDDKYFVIIQCITTKNIITFLPIEYYTFHTISDSILVTAKALAIQHSQHDRKSKFHITTRYRTDEYNTSIKHLAKMKIDDVKNNIEYAIESFKPRLRELCHKKNIPISNIISIDISYGYTGVRFEIDGCFCS